MINLGQAMGGVPTIFIRFNPDRYEPAIPNTRQDNMVERYNRLIHCLQTLSRPSFECLSLVQVIYLYFDGYQESDDYVLTSLFHQMESFA